MFYLKLVTQLVTGIGGLLTILLDYKWHDKRTKLFKRLRGSLIAITIFSLAIGIYITIQDDKDKNDEIKSLTNKLDSANNTLRYIKASGDTLKNQMNPFLELAKSKYPNLSNKVALDSLKNRIKKLDSSYFYNSIKVSQLDEKAKKLEQKSKIISSLEFRMFVDEITPSSSLTDKETSAGIQSVVGLFDVSNTRYRFVTDFQFSVQQIQKNRRRVSFVYKPEEPYQVLGKNIDLLSKVSVFAFDFSKIPEIFGEPTTEKTFLVTCFMYLNGVQISIFDDYSLPKGRLYKGQVDIPVSSQFVNIEKKYSEYIDKEIGGSRLTQ